MNYQLYYTPQFRFSHPENPIIYVVYLEYIILKYFIRLKLNTNKIWLVIKNIVIILS